MHSSLEKNFDRFRREFAHAYENVPFYQKLINNSALDPSHLCAVRDIKSIPFTSKKDYRKNFPVGVMAKGNSFSDTSLYRSQSSGTMGERLTTLEHGMLLLDRAFKCSAVNMSILKTFATPNKKTCRYAAPNCSDVECANPNSTMEDRLLHDGTLVLPVYHDLLTTSEQLIDRAIDEVLNYNADLYYVDPTHFAFLVRHFRRKGIPLPNAPVLATYSGATQISKRRIKQALGETALIAELVAMSEMGWLAMECPHGHLHLNDASFMMEFVNKNGEATESELGELVISSLDCGVIPHLRYRTGDVYRVTGADCPCGHPSRTVLLEGRLSHFLILPDQQSVSPKAIDSIIGAPDWLEQYQLLQKSDNQYTLKLITNDSYASCAADTLCAALGDLLNSDSVAVELVDYIASERSGKFQCVKPDINAATFTL